MANQEQLSILKQGFEVWNQWREKHLRFEVELSKADLSKAMLRGVDLSRANLSDANLNEVDLSKADLRGANLNVADLRGATLSGANLIGAEFVAGKLRGADFRATNLTNANLSGADLRKSNLMGANLTGAKLPGANLTNSKTGHTIFADIDLSETLGLETVRHFSPSMIGMDTIRRSKGKLPVSFLRGCGLSDLDIECAKLAAPGLDPEQVTQITYEIYRLYRDQPIQFYSCFISYSSLDHDFTQRLHDDLQNNGVRCWFAPEDLKIGDELRQAIGKEIRIRDKLLLILSENSIGSEWVGDEVEKALAEEREQKTLKLFPIRLDDAVLKSKDDWAEKIKLRRHIGDFSKDYAASLERLLRDLKPA